MSGIESVGMTLKERMALLNDKSSSSADGNILLLPLVPPELAEAHNGVALAVKPKVQGSKPAPPGNKPVISPNKPSVPVNKSPIKPKHNGTENNEANSKMPAIDIKLIEKRKGTLKYVESKRSSSVSTSDTKEDNAVNTEKPLTDADTVTDSSGRKFRKLKFVRKPMKPAKPKSLSDVVLAPVEHVDAETGAELRIGGGRRDIGSNSESLIKSLTEEDEALEVAAAVPPPLPKALPPRPPHTAQSTGPTLPNRRTQPLPLPTPEVEEEAEYGDGEAADPLPTDGGQEVYEEFEEGTQDDVDPSAVVEEPAIAPAPLSPVEDSRKLSKAEKEKKKKEKKEQEKIQKMRMNEIKEQEAFIKKYKVSDEELVSSHFVQAKAACSSSGKWMLALQVGEKVALIRKTGCLQGKWIVKNLNTQTIGLVDVSNMVDLEEITVDKGTAVTADDNYAEEDIYEEVDTH